MKLKIFGAVVFWIISSSLAANVMSQTGSSPIPYNGSRPFEKYKPIPPDPPNPAATPKERLGNGYTRQQMEWLRADPHFRIHPDGTIERLHVSNEELMNAARNNPHLPQAPPDWNMRSAPLAPTPSVQSGEVPGPHPIKPASN
jgi:hypothetical protein